jgi:PAS domain S-box-containing protein
MARLILVEDEMIIAKDIQSRLHGTDHDIVSIVATGEDAIAQAGELRPDVVLMDIVLKGEMDGIDAAQQIIERFDIPIIFLTAHTDATTVKRATATASYGFLFKPFDVLELSGAIETAISMHGVEEKARESDSRVRELTESLSEMIFETDMAGTITFINHAGLKEFGYTKEQVEGGMTLYDLVSPDKHEEIRESIAQAVIDEPSEWIEVPGVRRDGSTFPVSVRASLIIREGVPVGIRGIALNVTEQKRAEQQREESERHFREITDALPVVVYEADATGCITFVNATAFDMFGYTKDELEAGMSIFRLVTDADKERALTSHRRRLSGADLGRIEYAALRKDGSTCPISVRAVSIRRNGAVVGVRGIVVDITERKQAEERVREHVHAIETLNRISTEGNRASDVQSFAETVTDLTLELLHFDVGTIHLYDADARRANLCYATGIPDIAVAAIDGIPLEEALYAHVLVEGKPLFVDGDDALRVPHAAQLGLKSLAVMPLYHYDKRIGALNIGSFTHHTFSQSERDLLVAIGNEAGVVIAKLQTDELMMAALKERETLLKEIHHRVKNNMQIISSLLSLQAAQATERETIDMLNESQSRIRSMALIHEKLYRSGSLAEIDFGDYIDSLIDELLRMYNVPLGVITITADIENIQLGVDTAIPCALIINELVSNSLKHAFPDGRAGDVTVALQRANGAHTLTVADDGVGFPADLDFRTTDSLGMQLVSALINQLEGTIELNRENGMAFVISFHVD